MLKYRGHTIGDACTCGQVHDARRLRSDPTGTASIRRAYAAELDIRWRSVRRMVRAVIVEQDLLGRRGGGPIGADSAMRVSAFSDWITSSVQTTVLDVGTARRYVERASDLGVRTASAEVGAAGQTRGRVDLIVGLALSELRAIGAQVAQQSARAVSSGLLQGWTAARVAAEITKVIDGVGITRSRLVADHVVVRAYNDATLDVFEKAGHDVVDVMPELRLPVRVGDAKRKKASKRKTGSRKTGPGSRVSRKRTPSGSTIARIQKMEAETEAWAKRVNVQTAEDDDVCPICLDIAENGPYTINRARSLIPAHPRCRCAFVPVRRRVRAKDFNPYHEPKGSSRGGQFASSGGTGRLGPDFQNPDTGERKNEKAYDDFKNETIKTPWSDDEIEALRDYSFQGFVEINSDLRSGTMSSETSAKIRSIDSALEKAELSRDVLSYRTVSDDLAAKINRSKDGDLFYDDGYVSVSTSMKSIANLNENNGTSGPVLTVSLPKGTHAAPVAHVSDSPEDNEILVARGGVYAVRLIGKNRILQYVGQKK